MQVVSGNKIHREKLAFKSLDCKTVGFFLKIGPLQLAIHVVQNRRAGEQKSHWDKTNELLESMGLQQHVNEPTHESGHTLDLIITRQCDSLLAKISVTDCLLSDHSTLICDLILDKPPLPKKQISFRKTKVVDVNLYYVMIPLQLRFVQIRQP